MSDLSDAGDREARFVVLYEATYVESVRFAQRRVLHGQAEDVVGDAFLTAWRRLDDAPADLEDARAWLLGIVRKTILNTHRGVRRQRALAVRLAETVATSTPDDAELVARQVDLVQAWKRLSAIHQEALALAVFDDLSARQASAVLGITAVAFRLRLSRARRALRAQLGHRPIPSLPTQATERQHQ